MANLGARENWSVSTLRNFIHGRTRDGGVWQLEGGLVALGNGRILADIIGVDECVLSEDVRPIQTSVKQLAGGGMAQPSHGATLLSRCALFYVEPGTRRRMRTFRYRPTTPAREVAPAVTESSTLRVTLESGALALERGPARVVVPAAKPGYSGVLRAAWAYVARPLRGGGGTPRRPGAVETFDYSLSRGGGTLAWSRVSRCPSWYGGGQCLTYLNGTRVKGGWERLDEVLKLWLREVGRDNPLNPK